MYYISKTFEIAAAHSLSLDYGSKCSRLHGHNYRIEVHCRAERLDANGMVTDFRLVKERVCDVLDHRNLNEVLPFNPTSENMAAWICSRIPNCYKVCVEETDGNRAIYVKDEDRCTE